MGDCTDLVRSMPETSTPSRAKRSASCLEDGLLLAIARGDISEPALSHYLAHLEDCIRCCTRSIELERAQPGDLTSKMRRIMTGLRAKGPGSNGVEQHPPANPLQEGGLDEWLATLRGLRPASRLPILLADGAGHSCFGNLQVQSVLGEGTASVVYKALDPELNRQVALKVLRPDVAQRPGMAASFLREARALAGVRDNHLVVLHKYSRDPAPHLEMELLNGRTLAEALVDGPLAAERAVGLVGEIAQGLSRLHAAGLVHRDVKPANIWLDSDTPGGRAVLLDLGLVGEDNLSAGTRGYIAPEVNESTPPGPKADIYALGLVLRVMAMGAESGPRTQGKCPPELLPLINGMLRLNPADRPTAVEVVEMARQWQRQRGATRRMVLRGLVGGGLAAGGLLTGLAMWWSRPPKTVRELVRVPEAPQPEGEQPDRVVTGVFSPEVVAGIRQFTMLDGRHVAITHEGIHFAAAGAGNPVTCPLPERVEYTVLRDGLLAFARWNGEVCVWELSGSGTCKPAGTFQLDTLADPVVSLHLASAAEGKLLVHCGKKVYLAERVNGHFSGKPRALCEPDQFIAATGGAGLARLEFAPEDSGKIIAFTQRGGMVCTRLADMACVWGFRPFMKGPQQFVSRPGVPGGFAIGSPEGSVGVYGPEIVNDGKLAPHPEKGPSATLRSPVVQVDWLDTNRLVVLEAIHEKPFFVADISGGVIDGRQLGVASALRFHVDRATSSVHCLKVNGDVAVWELGHKKV